MMNNEILYILQCPKCGNSLKETGQNVFCRNCQAKYPINKNIFFFSEGKYRRKLSLKRFFSILLREVNPINHWPFSYLAQKKVEKLYDDYLNNKTVAKEFAQTYLPKECLEKEKEGIVLDFGCSRGRISALMNQLGFKVVGLDKVPNPWWDNLKNVTFVVFNVEEKLPFKDGIFDIILAFLALEYIPKDETIVREFNKKLKGRGYLVIQVPNKNHLRHLFTRRKLAPSHLREYSIEDITNLLEANNFRVEKIWTEKFYSPIFTNTFNYIFEILLPHKVLDFVSLITPQKYRGIINIIARKK